MREKLREVVRDRAHPHDIALGFSIATFWSLLPTPGVSILLGLATAFFLVRISKLALISGFAIWNPLITVPINSVGYALGDWMLGRGNPIETDVEAVSRLFHVGGRVFLGSGVIALVVAVVCYLLIRKMAQAVQKRRAQREALALTDHSSQN